MYHNSTHRSGYVPLTVGATSCSSGIWSHNPDQLICTEGIALITGSYPKDKSVEVYGPGLYRRLSDMPKPRNAHTVIYHTDGYLYACGNYPYPRTGVAPMNSCIRGEYDNKTRGWLIFYLYLICVFIYKDIKLSNLVFSNFEVLETEFWNNMELINTGEIN